MINTALKFGYIGFIILLLFQFSCNANNLKLNTFPKITKEVVNLNKRNTKNTIKKRQTYFYSNDGLINNRGLSQKEPHNNLENIKNINPGDSILFEAGSIWYGQLDFPYSGTKDFPIYIGLYGKGSKPIFNGAEKREEWKFEKTELWSTITNELESPFWLVLLRDNKKQKLVKSLSELKNFGQYFIDKSTRKLYIKNTRNPKYDNIEISKYQHGITLVKSQYVKIENLDFRYYGYSGIIIRGDQPEGFINVNKCSFYYNKISGLTLLNGHGNNTVSNCTSTFNGNGFYSIRSHNNIFAKDTFQNNFRYDVEGMFTDGHGIGIFRSGGTIVEKCYSENNMGGAVGFDPDANKLNQDFGAIIRYNYFKGAMNSSACIGIQDLGEKGKLEIYYNLIINDKNNLEPGFAIYSGFDIKGEVLIYNNTIYQNSKSYRSVAFRYSENVFFANNLIISKQKEGTLLELKYSTLIRSNYNNYFHENNYYRFKNNNRNFENFRQWKNATKQDKNSLNIDPQVDNYFRLTFESPAINAGFNIGANVDREGNKVIGNPDIGCHEYQF